MNNLYVCYSVPLMNFLKLKGLRYEIVALNKNTGNTMWIYIKSIKLSNALKEWSSKK